MNKIERVPNENDEGKLPSSLSRLKTSLPLPAAKSVLDYLSGNILLDEPGLLEKTNTQLVRVPPTKVRRKLVPPYRQSPNEPRHAESRSSES